MKRQNGKIAGKITLELKETHIKYCIRKVVCEDTHDDFFYALLAELPDLRYVMRDVHSCGLNTVHFGGAIHFVEPTRCADMEFYYKLFYSVLLANRNYKSYRQMWETVVNIYYPDMLSTIKKPIDVIVDAEGTEVSVEDAFDYLIRYALNGNFNFKYFYRKAILCTSDKCTNVIYTVLNNLLFTDNVLPLGIIEMLQLFEYLKASIKLSEVKLNDALPCSSIKSVATLAGALSCVAEIEKYIVDKSLTKVIKKCVAELNATELEKTYTLVCKFTEAIIKHCDELLLALGNRYKYSHTECMALSRAYAVNPHTFINIACTRYKLKTEGKYIQLPLSFSECIDIYKISSTAYFSSITTLITLYESDAFAQQLCTQLGEDDITNLDKVIETSNATILNLENKLKDVTSELSSATTQLQNLTRKEDNKTQTISDLRDEITNLKAELAEMIKKNAQLETSLSDIYDGVDEPDYDEITETLEEVLTQNSDVKIMLFTRSEYLVDYYSKFKNIKPVLTWSHQFDTRSVKEADIVIQHIARSKHCITEKIKNSLGQNSKLHLTKLSNIELLDKQIIHYIRINGRNQHGQKILDRYR